MRRIEPSSNRSQSKDAWSTRFCAVLVFLIENHRQRYIAVNGIIIVFLCYCWIAVFLLLFRSVFFFSMWIKVKIHQFHYWCCYIRHVHFGLFMEFVGIVVGQQQYIHLSVCSLHYSVHIENRSVISKKSCLFLSIYFSFILFRFRLIIFIFYACRCIPNK